MLGIRLVPLKLRYLQRLFNLPFVCWSKIPTFVSPMWLKSLSGFNLSFRPRSLLALRDKLRCLQRLFNLPFMCWSKILTYVSQMWFKSLPRLNLSVRPRSVLRLLKKCTKMSLATSNRPFIQSNSDTMLTRFHSCGLNLS